MSQLRFVKTRFNRTIAVIPISVMTGCALPDLALPKLALPKLATPSPPTLTSPSSMLTRFDPSMPSAPTSVVTATILEAYEDQSAPIGSHQGADRPIGHAVVRLRLESLVVEPIVAQVQVAIWDADRQEQLMTRDLGEITLGGRQILEPGLHLSNREGFQGIKQVKAIVTYQTENIIYTAESSLANVVINP